jgi:putative FmdB family regulatory protein
MPIYEYHCASCHQQFEALVPYDHRDDIACEKCGAAHITRLASTFASSSAEGGSASAMTGSCCGGSCSCCGD